MVLSQGLVQSGTETVRFGRGQGLLIAFDFTGGGIHAMSDPSNDETQRTAVPFRVLASQRIDSVAAAFGIFIGGFALVGAVAPILIGVPWGLSLFFAGVCGVLLVGACFAMREAFGWHSPAIGITREHLVLGRRRIPWQQITAPDVEVIETEKGGYLARKVYRVTFCIVGDRRFGTWRHLDPRRYVGASGMPDSHRADVLCGFLRQMRAGAIANRLDDTVAVPSSLNVVTIG